jgi:hypothetical protein
MIARFVELSNLTNPVTGKKDHNKVIFQPIKIVKRGSQKTFFLIEHQRKIENFLQRDELRFPFSQINEQAKNG